jgi:hypothetical protein
MEYFGSAFKCIGAYGDLYPVVWEKPASFYHLHFQWHFGYELLYRNHSGMYASTYGKRPYLYEN